MTKNTEDFLQMQDSMETTIDALADTPHNGMYSIIEIENMVNQLLKSLPVLNRDRLRDEMEDMIVPIEQNPTTYDINKGLALSQGYKDRLSEILSFAQREYKLRKRCLEMLFDAVNLISKASSADKRKGEATMKYPVMVFQVEAAEIFMKEVEQLYANMKSTADSISRQVSVMQMQISLGERRQSNPNGTDLVPQSSAEEITGNKEKAWDSF